MSQTPIVASAFVLPARPAVATPTLDNLSANAASGRGRQALVCRDELTPAERQLARAEAATLLPEMLASTPVFMAYGTAELKSLNDLSDRILSDVKSTEIPELTAIMKQTNQQMRAIGKKYDVSDSKVRAKLERGGGMLRRLLGRGRSLVEMLMDDARSLEATLDKVESELRGRQHELLRNVVIYDEFYKASEDEVRKLVVTIAVMEYVQELAAERVEQLRTATSLSDRDRDEQARMISEFALNLAAKIGDYKNRLFVGYATGPNLTMMRTIDIGVANKLNELVGLTIPTIKQAIALWRMRIRSAEAAQMGNVASGMANEVLQGFARNSADSTYAVAAFAQSSSLTPETITMMADSVSRQVDGLLKAYQDGQSRRNEVEAAIAGGRTTMAAAGQRLTDGVIDQVIRTATQPAPSSLAS